MVANSKVDIFGISVIILLTVMSVTGLFLNALVFITIIETRLFYLSKFTLLSLLALSDLTKSGVIIPIYIYVSKANLAKVCQSLVIADNAVNTCGIYFIVFLMVNNCLQKFYPNFSNKQHLKLQLILSILNQVLSSGYNIGLSVYFDKVLNKRNELCLPVNDVVFIWILLSAMYICPLLLCGLLIFIYQSSVKTEEDVFPYKSTTILSSFTTSFFERFSKKQLEQTKTSSSIKEIEYIPSHIFVLKPSFYSTNVTLTSVEGQNSNVSTPIPNNIPSNFKHNSPVLTSLNRTGRYLMHKISLSVKIKTSIHPTIIFFIISTPYYVIYICRPYWLGLGIDETLFVWLKLFNWLTIVINPLTFCLSNEVISQRARKNLCKICCVFKRKSIVH
uniref:GCR132 n=1 Tax=Schmidtea mediterranea TaxID=79327 RepID=A0A193KUT8_SCHMD|nr:GCR132 [Schmidtea mediterranea]